LIANNRQRGSSRSGVESKVSTQVDGLAPDNIRKFVARAHSLVELVDLQTLPPHAAEFLHASVVAGLNIVVSGGTQAGTDQAIF